jgi:hypothetical protein
MNNGLFPGCARSDTIFKTILENQATDIYVPVPDMRQAGALVFSLDIPAYNGAYGFVRLYVDDDYTDGNYQCMYSGAQWAGSVVSADGHWNGPGIGFRQQNRECMIRGVITLIGNKILCNTITSRINSASDNSFTLRQDYAWFYSQALVTPRVLRFNSEVANGFQPLTALKVWREAA